MIQPQDQQHIIIDQFTHIEIGPSDTPQPEFEPVIAESSPIHTAMVQAVVARTVELLSPVGTPADLIEPFGRALAEEIDNLLHKFAAGQLKHGGDIRDRELDLELHQEIQDALIYSVSKRLQRDTIRLAI